MSITGENIQQGSFKSVLRPFLSGALGGTCSAIILQPLDLLKTRLQAPVVKEKRLKIRDIFINVVKNEGVFRLWRGLTPTLFRTVPGIGLYFCSLEGLQRLSGIRKPNSIENLLLGFTARSFVGCILLPVTVLKTRFESLYYDRYRGIMAGFRQILYQEGFRGMFVGLVPTLLRDAPFSAFYLMFYRYEQKLIGEEVLSGRWSSVVYLICGINAGVISCLITHPFDVLKTQMQLFPNKYTSTMKTASLLYQTEGTSAFLRGIIPRALRRTLMSALSWMIYEKLSQRII